MNSNTGNASNQGQGNTKIQSFLEALRNSQARSFENDSQEPRTNPFVELQQKKEAEKRRAELFFQARQQEWNKVFSSKEKQAEDRIEEIRVQLKNLAKQVKKLDTNLLKAVESPISQVGAYHESFLAHIQKMIQIFSLKVQEANSWLEMYNSRSTKKGTYWSMAKSKGNEYTQANERAVATSVG
ncbi:TPA: hypothetical protein DIU27_02210 [Candidatus Collierbacteria bacterium]|uniref:DUF5660 domain-containing protein n=1 Tax=Candidatus Collierbacteria bacterium GW2011_GWB2_44_22 TaxID=1618387 RepID=A0A0G1HXX0_9BACT|nr:MAG: hypothetical protein UW31_C0009G0037 [Candidatus Collierbacteria bacterium GW2011_GWA2_44_13]KKT51991.1 MAG: hypothetical protein UW44_C0005G0033 [Candidatus Collierbacteria bacterium GW2011_GWB2_44_22]KKT62287.1 MAG: hypothetical protein UW56_C0009G0061 [Candidatus Collierbacteria bacterium GW2011_GWD1_44_27]KKT66633.1 MAG: hypothetical protein UW58_C0005G0029 [Candidatus Collierbacteria bacterium GW2011_GWC2_44_30]KKT69413.1 MAG: hypothetical protein UW64_C0001G0059 [Microgenomates gr